MLPDLCPNGPVENTKKRVLACPVGGFTEDTVQQTWRKTNSRPASLREQRNTQALKKCLNTTPKLKTKAKRLRRTKHNKSWKNKKKSEEGFEGRMPLTWQIVWFCFSLNNSLSAARRQGGKQECESAFNSQQKNSSAGTEICLREGWTANYKELK